MLTRAQCRSLLASLLIVVAAVPPLPAGAEPTRDKIVWSYEGGVFLEADGQIGEGQCFRMKGRMEAPGFFEGLKEETTASGFLFRRGNDIVTEFPKQLHLSLLIFDFPCKFGIYDTGPRVYLTDDAIRNITFHFQWKRELEMRPARGVKLESAEVRPIPVYNSAASETMRPRNEWLLQFDVPSEKVPLTDSLVIVLQGAADHRIIARTSARL